MADRNVNEVEDILKSLNLSTLWPIFKDNKLTEIEVCLNLDNPSLQSLGLETMGDRIRFQEALKRYKGKSNTSLPTDTGTSLRQTRLLFGRSRRRTETKARDKKKSAARSWTASFVCLSDKDASTVPNGRERVVLQSSGQGFKRIVFSTDDDENEVKQKLSESFPKLIGIGGFELLKCLANKRKLEVLGCTWNVQNLKAVMSPQSRIFIRPIQKNLETVDVLSDNEGTLSFNSKIKEECLKCGQLICVTMLRAHIITCCDEDSDMELPDIEMHSVYQDIWSSNEASNGSNVAELYEERPNLNDQVSNRNGREASNGSDVAELHTERPNLNDQVSNRNGREASNGSNVAELHTQRPNLNDQVSNRNGREASNGSNVAELHTERPNLNDQVSNRNGREASNGSNVAELQTERQNLDDRVSNRNGREASNGSNVAELHTERQNLDDQVSNRNEASKDLDFPVHVSPKLSKDIEDIVENVVKECSHWSNPIEILKFLQANIIVGRKLEVDDVTETIASEGETNHICVDRENILETAFDEIQQIKNFRPTLEVDFYGESVSDLGGPRKEFFRLVLMAIKEKYFDHDLRSVLSEDYLTVGKILVEFTARTDHGALSWLLRFKNPEGQMARWLEILGTYKINIQHRPGKLHGNADGMSRRPCHPCDFCNRQESKEKASETTEKVCLITAIQTSEEREYESWLQNKTKEEIGQEQKNDAVLSHIFKWKENNQRPVWEEISHLGVDAKSYWSKWNMLEIADSLLYIVTDSDDTSRKRKLVVPTSLQNDVMYRLHNAPGSGHFGVARTISRVKERFYWARYTDTVKEWCKRCKECQKRKQPQRKPRAHMKQYIVGAPMERVAIDILGPLPESTLGNKYILIATDYFTRWTECYAMADQEAKTVALLVMNEFFSRFGLPRQIITDQGRQFESKLFQEMCKLLQIDKTRTTPYHPQCDGLVERFNRTVEDILNKYIAQDQRDWDQHLALATLAYLSSVHESTGYSPCMLMLGREVELPLDLIYGKPPDADEEDSPDLPDFVEKLRQRLWRVHDNARHKMAEASDRQKKTYDHRANQQHYKVGDAVWLKYRGRQKGISPKLQIRWDGPFIVTRRRDDLIYEIQRNRRSKIIKIHHDNLKPYHGEVDNFLVNRDPESLSESRAKDKGEGTEVDGVRESPKQVTPNERRHGKRIRRPPKWMSLYNV